MNPIAVRIFDISQSKTVSEHFYSMCVTNGENVGCGCQMGQQKFGQYLTESESIPIHYK